MENEMYCERCGEKLNEKTAVCLELNNSTGLYVLPDTIPAGQVSQGGFFFGSACAKQVLKAGGHVVTTGKRKALRGFRR